MRSRKLLAGGLALAAAPGSYVVRRHVGKRRPDTPLNRWLRLDASRCARIDRMKSIAIDANVIVRYLTGDVLPKKKSAHGCALPIKSSCPSTFNGWKTPAPSPGMWGRKIFLVGNFFGD